MAVIQYSALLTQLRGKLGGSQFNKGHNSYSLQRKSQPVIRQTILQMQQRQRVATVQRSWKNESGTRQAESSQASTSNPTTDRFGQQVVLSGYQYYVKMMVYRLIGGYPMGNTILTTPANAYTISLTVTSVTVANPVAPNTLRLQFVSTRVASGTPTGLISQSRIFLYIQLANANGGLLRPRRRILLSGITGAGAGAYNPDISLPVTGVVFRSGDYAVLSIDTVNMMNGAVTGRWSQLVQLS